MFGTLITPLLTPFDRFSNLTFSSLKRLIDHLYQTKTSTLIVNTPIGETIALSEIEKQLLIEKTLAYADGRMGVIVNLPIDNIHRLSDQVRRLNRLGIRGFMVDFDGRNEGCREVV